MSIREPRGAQACSLSASHWELASCFEDGPLATVMGLLPFPRQVV